jgi:hypothetical protein
MKIDVANIWIHFTNINTNVVINCVVNVDMDMDISVSEEKYVSLLLGHVLLLHRYLYKYIFDISRENIQIFHLLLPRWFP